MRPVLTKSALLLVAFCVGGCVASKTPHAERKKAYLKLAALIQQGMTRRQVYALLPPQEVPQAHPPGAISPGSPDTHYTTHREDHPLDRDFGLSVEYRLASESELRLYEHDIRSRLNELNVAVKTLRRKLGGKFDDLYSRDLILINVPSRQNMADEVLEPPVVVQPGVEQTGHFRWLDKREKAFLPRTQEDDVLAHDLMKELQSVIKAGP